MELYLRQHGHDVLTNLRSLTYWGRPVWVKMLKQVRSKHPQMSIGVFYCGPPKLAKELARLCTEMRMSFHHEQFGY